MIEGLGHLLFPAVCALCRKPLEKDEDAICTECFAEFSPFPGAAAGGEALIRTVCSHFGQTALPAGAWGLYPYRSAGRLHEAMHALKYGGLFPLGTLFGRRLGELIRQDDHQGTIEAIVPVPLHPLKRIERSYNQAEMIADGIAGVLGLPVSTQCLERRVHTASQTGLGLKERRENMTGAFRPGRRSCTGRVLLVDDVLTTGATMVAAAEALKESGAGEVLFAVVALTAKE